MVDETHTRIQGDLPCIDRSLKGAVLLELYLCIRRVQGASEPGIMLDLDLGLLQGIDGNVGGCSGVFRADDDGNAIIDIQLGHHVYGDRPAREIHPDNGLGIGIKLVDVIIATGKIQVRTVPYLNPAVRSRAECVDPAWRYLYVGAAGRERRGGDGQGCEVRIFDHLPGNAQNPVVIDILVGDDVTVDGDLTLIFYTIQGVKVAGEYAAGTLCDIGLPVGAYMAN